MKWLATAAALLCAAPAISGSFNSTISGGGGGSTRQEYKLCWTMFHSAALPTTAFTFLRSQNAQRAASTGGEAESSWPAQRNDVTSRIQLPMRGGSYSVTGYTATTYDTWNGSAVGLDVTLRLQELPGGASCPVGETDGDCSVNGTYVSGATIPLDASSAVNGWRVDGDYTPAIELLPSTRTLVVQADSVSIGTTTNYIMGDVCFFIEGPSGVQDFSLNVLGIGDSNMEADILLSDDPGNVRWTDLVMASTTWTINNQGDGGSPSMEWADSYSCNADWWPSRAEPFLPGKDYVLIQLGTNDASGNSTCADVPNGLAEGESRTAPAYNDYMTEILDDIIAAGVTPFLIIPLERRSTASPDRIAALDVIQAEAASICATRAAEVGCVDFSALSIPDEEYIDEPHPGQYGHNLMAQAVIDAVNAWRAGT